MEYLLLVVGFALLIKGADWFVDGSAAAARRLHIPTVIVGLTIVSLGTSLPELSVSLTAAIQGRNALALSNVLGSNIFNTLVVVGCSALLAPFVMGEEIRKRDTLWNLGVSVLLAFMCYFGMLTRVDGIILLVVLCVYLAVLIRSALADRKKAMEENNEEETSTWTRCLTLMAVGVICIGFGGTITVDAAKAIALAWGWSEALVGLTIVSIGTSLPELVTSVVAAKKGESGLSIGNALGSNIMNILFILGLSSAIHPIAVLSENFVDAVVLCAIALFIWIMARFSDKLDRKRGVLFLVIYGAYFIYILNR